MSKITTTEGQTSYDSNSVMNLAALAKNKNQVDFHFTSGNILSMVPISSDKSSFGHGYIEISYGAYFKNTEGEDDYNFFASEYFSMDNATIAACSFVFRANSKFPHHESGLGLNLNQIEAKLKKHDPISLAKSHLADALSMAEQKGVEGMGETRAIGDMIQRLTTLQGISSVRKL